MNLIPAKDNSPLTGGALAPVVVFTYTRVDHFVRTIEALKNNYLDQSEKSESCFSRRVRKLD